MGPCSSASYKGVGKILKLSIIDSSPSCRNCVPCSPHSPHQREEQLNHSLTHSLE
uniref:Uncharacterized protein n=1 Tax=Oryza brachyantha TaxID=4533 RepID=J3LSS2_ORYBR